MHVQIDSACAAATLSTAHAHRPALASVSGAILRGADRAYTTASTAATLAST
jgi:hypothetical protein